MAVRLRSILANSRGIEAVIEIGQAHAALDIVGEMMPIGRLGEIFGADKTVFRGLRLLQRLGGVVPVNPGALLKG